jgi:hypothetical protein
MRPALPQVMLGRPNLIGKDVSCIRLEEAHINPIDLGLKKLGRNAKRNIYRIHARTVFSAALHFSGQQSAYGLEKQYIRESEPEQLSEHNWAGSRCRLWDRCARGDCTVIAKIRNKDMQAIRRLDAIQRLSPNFYPLVNLLFWRYMDPAELLYVEVMRDRSWEDLPWISKELSNSHGLETYSGPSQNVLGCLLEAVERRSTRYQALTALWQVMRCCAATGRIDAYIRLYGAWLSCRQYLSHDPVLGAVSDDLYRHTNLYFSTLYVNYS